MSSVRGFNHLSGSDASQPRSWLGPGTLFGLLLGLLLGSVWMAAERQELQVLQEEQSRLQTELAHVQAQAAQVAEQARRLQAAREQHAHLLAAQLRHQQWLAILEDLAHSTGARLSLLRLDAQGLLLQGQIDAAGLQAWAAARPAASFGLGSPQLLELSTEPQAPASQRMRFVLRWPAQAAGGTP